ncbi:MAG: cysteine desulfurase, partial [Clostridia bacterium]|nr:cysteine desulfurase [Clostridia bacterium]
HSRETVREFINAKSVKEVVFTRNASESLNLVAFTFADMVLEEGDEVLVSILEHHSNMLPWREAAKRKGATVKYLEVDLTGEVTPETVQKALTPKTKILAITQVSNIMGRENDIKAFAKLCHDNGTYIVCDGAQSVPHMPVDVQDLDVDFLAFSGHKMLAPMGVGVLYGKEEHFAAMPPFLTGGEMISTVSYDGMTLSELPHKFEAGTVNASGAVALEAAIEYIKGIGFEDIQARETALCKRILDGIKDIPHVTVLGSDKPEEHHGIVTFKVDGVHPHDISAILADNNVALRAGHHCAQPLHICLGIPSTTRASVMFYNTEEEVDRFLDVLSQIRGAMGYGD